MEGLPLLPMMEKTGRTRDGTPIYRLTEPFTYKDLTVPAGFETDVATRFFFGLSSIVADPGDMRIWAAAVIHDYGINQNHPKRDQYFAEILKINGVGAFRRWLMVTFIKWWSVA